LRVDNGFKLWKYDGTLFHSEEIKELYQVKWKPVHPNPYPHPRILEVAKKAEETKGKVEAAKPGKYIPPHHRGIASATTIVKATASEIGPTKYSKPIPVAKPIPDTIVGDTYEPKKKSRNRKKKGNKEDKKDEKKENEEEEEEVKSK